MRGISGAWNIILDGLKFVEKIQSSHPETKERIERMTKRCEKDGIERPASAEK